MPLPSSSAPCGSRLLTERGLQHGSSLPRWALGTPATLPLAFPYGVGAVVPILHRRTLRLRKVIWLANEWRGWWCLLSLESAVNHTLMCVWQDSRPAQQGSAHSRCSDSMY